MLEMVSHEMGCCLPLEPPRVFPPGSGQDEVCNPGWADGSSGLSVAWAAALLVIGGMKLHGLGAAGSYRGFGIWLIFETQIPQISQTDSQIRRHAAALREIALAVRGPH